jgi:murein DD-endopeptidase MepM/ murein hydrolase activator NlpD
MCASRWWAFWTVAISLGLGAASCTDNERFSNFLGSGSATRSDVTGFVPEYPPAAVGSVVALPAPTWAWEGGTPIIVAPGDTLDMISRKYGVPASTIMQTNNFASPGAIRVGQRLVIPRRRSSHSTTAYTPRRHGRSRDTSPRTHIATAKTALARNSTVHVVAPGDTLYSIARRYRKPATVLARANKIPAATKVRVGERIVIPGIRPVPRAKTAPPKEPASREVASTEYPHSTTAATVPPPVQQTSLKTAEPVGALPSFLWPVRGRIIAGFGAKPSGLQNDGIDLAVPEGTPIKAADDGVVAYASNELRGYGNLVLIRHSSGYITAYAHASKILVKRGETVKRGQVIAESGETGNVKSPELHFEIRKGASPLDPTRFLNGA